jgi:hypothetical protein
MLEEALRTSKRPAAPFSRQEPKAHPQKPGRKSGPKYGRRCRRPVPERIDEVVEVPLPAQCPRCGGGWEECATVSQFQTEIPEPRVERIEFRIQVGRCRCCRRRVQGRHPRQISNAIGGAASQLGGKRGTEFPRQIQAILQPAIQLRDRRQQERICDHGVAVARGRLEARLDQSLQRCDRSSSSARARRSIYLSELSRPGGHQLASRTDHPADGGGAQGMGWKSHGPRSADSKYSGQLSANLQPAVAACILASPESALFLSAQNPGLSRSYALNNYNRKS